MARNTKKNKLIKAKVQVDKDYPLDEALNLVKEFAVAKFPESIDVAVKLGIDVKILFHEHLSLEPDNFHGLYQL